MKLNSSIEDFNLELDNLPDYETYVSNLSQLTELCKKELSPKEIKELFYEYAVIFPNIALPLESAVMNLFTAYRFRLNINKEVEDLKLIRTFSYPSPNLCNTNGRANLKGRAVFYAGDNVISSLAEVRPKKGDMAYLSIWKINCNRISHVVPFLSKNISSKNRLHKMAQNMHDDIIKQISVYRGDKIEHLKCLFSFMSNIFITESHPYTIPSWASDSMLYDYNGIDCIIYPSCQLNTTTCNFAFHPNFADQFLMLDRVIQMHITNVNEKEVSFSVQKIGLLNRTNISWRLPTDEDMVIFNKQEKV